MKLADFMRDRELDDAAMANRLGDDVSAWAVRKWRYGQRVPRREMQKRILDATDGSVTPNDFFEAAEEAADRSPHDTESEDRSSKGLCILATPTGALA